MEDRSGSKINFMDNKEPFINVEKTGSNFTMKNCVLYGDRPTIKTAARNTTLVGVKHFSQKFKLLQPLWVQVAIGVIVILLGLIIEYSFFK